MNIYILSGFSAPLAARATFLIPYFSLVGTNEVFAQELNVEFEIEDFYPFTTDHFESVASLPNPIPRQKGLEGVLGVRLATGAIIYGDARYIRRELSKSRKLERLLVNSSTSFVEASFFNVEASEFLRKPQDVVAAIAAVSKRLTASHSAIWSGVETGAYLSNKDRERFEGAAAVPKLEHVSQGVVDDPFQNFDDPKWVQKWRVKWYDRAGRREMLRAATEWLSHGELSRYEVPEVIGKCLTSFHRDAEVRNFAVRWLALKEYHSIYWGPIWLSVNDRRTEPALTEDAFLFLGSTTKLQDIRSVNVWSRVWRRLLSQLGPSKPLLRLGQEAVPAFKVHKNFVQMVLLPLSKEPQPISPMVQEAIVEWLKTNFKGTKVWTGIFCGLFAKTSDVAELEKLGSAWLRQYSNINQWKNVWNIIRKRTGTSKELIDLGRLWIERAYPDIHIWPEVMTTILDDGNFAPVEIELAKKWLAVHSARKDTKAYQKLDSVVASRLKAVE